MILLREFEEAFPGWYHNPARWPTQDGVIPHRLFSLLVRTLEPGRAKYRLDVAKAIGIAIAGEEGDGPQLVNNAVDDAFPECAPDE